jgi:hypothetical protein
MAKARAQLLAIHQDDIREDDAEQTLDESADPLEESGRTVDSSDEEVEESVAEDIARFEDSFAGINKRYRLINRIGEGEYPSIGRLVQGGVLDSPRSCRYLFHRIQGRRPGIQQFRQPLGHRRAREPQMGVAELSQATHEAAPLCGHQEDLCHEQSDAYLQRARTSV